MAVQSTYSAAMAAAVAGMKANMEKSNVISRVAEGVIGFGAVVIRGTGDNQCKAVAAGVYDAAVTAKVGNTGNGVLTLANPKTGTGVKLGDYKVTIIEPATDAGIFMVEDPDGVALPTGTVAVAYDNQIRFTLADGATNFVAGDQFTVTVTESGAGAPHVLGISLKNEVQPAAASNPDQYNATDIVPIMTEGVIWVVNGSGGAVVQGDLAHVVPGTGAITNAGAGNVRIPGAEFDSSGANGALVKLRLK